MTTTMKTRPNPATAPLLVRGRAPTSWFRLDRHLGVRSTLPAAIQAIMQNGMLDRTFQDALVPNFLFPAVATPKPWQGGMGDTVTFTRTGLLTPQSTPITGSDPTVDTYGVEQWSATMDQYGNAVDTNMLQSAMTLASKFLENVQKLGINAGQSLNRIARTRLYNAYGGGNSSANGAGAAATALVVRDATGFDKVLSNGVPVAVSGTNMLAITIAGAGANVTGCNLGTNTLTLAANATWNSGDAVVAVNAPVVIRAGARASAFALTSGDVATMALFRAAVARLRGQNVPTLGGNYVAHVDAITEQELFGDADFKLAYQGRGDSPVFQNLSIGTFGGIDWVRNLETPTTIGTGGLIVHRPIVLGADSLYAAPFADIATLLRSMGTSDAADSAGNIQVITGPGGLDLAMITRPPLDRLQQVVGSAWSWIGDFSVPSDSVTGDPALFKRAAIVEHA